MNIDRRTAMRGFLSWPGALAMTGSALPAAGPAFESALFDFVHSIAMRRIKALHPELFLPIPPADASREVVQASERRCAIACLKMLAECKRIWPFFSWL